MKKRLTAISLLWLGILSSLVSVQAQSTEEQVEAMSNSVSIVEFDYLTDEILEQGVYNAELNRMEYIVESFDEYKLFGNENDIRILRTVYAYYYLSEIQHKVDVIHEKRQRFKTSAGTWYKTWEETIRSYNESHSFSKQYTSNSYRSGEYGYYEYDYICSKCNHRKKGGVDKIYIGPGTGLPSPSSHESQY